MTDDIDRTLTRVGKRRKRNEEQRSAISRELGDAVRAAKAAGKTPTYIANKADVSRQTVHDHLREETIR